MQIRATPPTRWLARKNSWARARLYITILSLAVTIILVVAERVRCHDLSMLDGFMSCLFPIVFREDTEYAPGYSNEAFRKLRRGMSAQEVLALLGPPLGKYSVEGGREGWRWSRSPGDRSYRVRVAIFERGSVSEIIHRFYLD